MTTSVQISQSSDDLCHLGKPMPALKPTVLYNAGKLWKDRPVNETINSKFRSRGIEDDDLQGHIPVITHSKSLRGHPRGVSEECLALASACSHDHDYSTPTPETSSPRGENNEVFRRRTISPAIIVKKEAGDSYGGDEFVRKPRAPSQLRSRRVMLVKKASIDLKTVQSLQRYNGESKKPVPPEKRNSEDATGRHNEKRRETVSVSNQSSERDSSFDLKIPNVSGSKETKDSINIDVLSPRPSITPFPPAERHRQRRVSCTRKQISEESAKVQNDVAIKKEPEDDFVDPCKTSIDSAYNSLTCSASSKPRTPSGNRPPSGGKRSATCGLTSSSSSGTSSDEWSDIETPRESVPPNAEPAAIDNPDQKTQSNNTSFQKNAFVSTPRARSKISSGKKLRKQSSRVDIQTAAKQSTNENEKVQFVPTPPARKPKKGKYYRSVPMKLRALPTSFWEEPNCTNAVSHYTILPPVQPLFQQHENEDMADIRPVTPPNEKETAGSRQAISAAGYDRPRNRTIIRTGDTDLLLRLFDKVEAKQNQMGIRAKRGRPKRPSYCVTPSSRRSQNENPCIMNSITEKLFPKLSLDGRYPVAAMVTSSGILTSALPIRSATENSSDEPKSNQGLKHNFSASDHIPSGFLSDDSPTSSLSFPPEVTMDMGTSSPSPTFQPRPSPILPQLVAQKEYSHLLNELAAAL